MQRTLSPLHILSSGRVPLATTLVVCALMLGSTPAAGGDAPQNFTIARTQASIRVTANVVSLTGGREVAEASEQLLADYTQIVTGGMATATADIVTERYLEAGLIRISLLGTEQSVAGEDSDDTPAATTTAANLETMSLDRQVLVEYVGS